MIEINLLPHREARRRAELRRAEGLLILGLVGVLLAVGLVHANLVRQADHALAQVLQLEADLERFKPQQEKVESFKLQKRSLEQKLAAIARLDEARRGPLHLLAEISDRTPDRLWLTQLRADGPEIILEGSSLDTSVVADFLGRLNDSTYFREVDLDRTAREREVRGVKLVNFTITAVLEGVAEPIPGEGA